MVAIPAGAAAVGPFVPKFRFVLADLTTADTDAMHADGVSPVTELTIRALKETRAARDLGALLTTWRRALRQLLLHPHSLDALRQIFSYLLSVRGRRDLETLDLQALDIDGESKATMTTMAGALIQQGLEQGLQQGLQQGRQGDSRRAMRPPGCSS